MNARLPAVALAAALASGCGWFSQPVPQPFPVTVYPLPGGLNDVPVFNSDRPETLRSDGVLLDSEAIGYRFNGMFGLFSHHVGRMPVGNPGPLHLALLATNHGKAAVNLEKTSGTSWTTRPEAPYLDLPAFTLDPAGTTFAGPGDRVATDWLHGHATDEGRWSVAPGETKLIGDLAMPVSIKGTGAANGRSTLATYTSDGPLSLAEVGAFGSPSADKLRDLVAAGVPAGPTDVEATPLDPRPTGSLRYGRVCGVSVGDAWHGELQQLPAPGQAVGYPIASLYANRMGTGQIQSAPLAARSEGSAYQSHGNYGVTYHLTMHLPGPGTYYMSFSSPLKANDEPPSAIYFAKGSAVTFRGPLRLMFNGETRHYHQVLHQGELPAPFETLEVPDAGLDATFSLLYPADCTPPQLLMIARR